MREGHTLVISTSADDNRYRFAAPPWDISGRLRRWRILARTEGPPGSCTSSQPASDGKTSFGGDVHFAGELNIRKYSRWGSSIGSRPCWRQQKITTKTEYGPARPPRKIKAGLTPTDARRSRSTR